RVPLLSTVDGEWVRGPLDGEYWYRNLRRPVRFDQAVRTLTESGYRAFVEVSPHPVLTSAIGDIAPDAVVAGTLRRGEGGWARLLTSAAELHVRGTRIDWRSLLPGTPRTDLPTYPFQHERFWLSPAARRPEPTTDHPLLDSLIVLPDDGGVIGTARLSVSAQPWLADHVVSGRVLVPAAVLLDLITRT